MNTIHLNSISLNKVELNIVGLFEGKSPGVSLKYEWTTSQIDNPEFKRVYLDNANHVLYGVRVDNSVVSPQIPTDIKKDILILEKQYR